MPRVGLYRVESTLACGGSGEDPHYVFDALMSGTSLVVSLSDMSIQHLDASTGALLSRFSAHRDRINTIELSSVNPGLVLSASSDKTVALWDLRTPAAQTVARLMLPDEVLSASLGAGDALVAAACGQSVDFFDFRAVPTTGRSQSSKPIGSYADAHTDVVTQVKFHPLQSSVLLSAAEDGLICSFDTAAAADESAVLSVLNTDCPVRRFGFFGPELQGLYCLSTVETASVWHWGSALRLGSFPDVRERLAVDYLVDCIYCPAGSGTSTVTGAGAGAVSGVGSAGSGGGEGGGGGGGDELLLLGGDYGGRGVLAVVGPDQGQSESESQGQGQGQGVVGGMGVRLCASLQVGGHGAMIRCCSALGAGSGAGAGAGLRRLLTGGEDGRVVSWALAEGGGGGGASAVGTGGGGAARRDKASAALRRTPY